jgi:hypothetical protein
LYFILTRSFTGEVVEAVTQFECWTIGRRLIIIRAFKQHFRERVVEF